MYIPAYNTSERIMDFKESREGHLMRFWREENAGRDVTILQSLKNVDNKQE